MNYLSVVGSAIGNKCRNWYIRESQFAETGIVLVAKFNNFERAKKFAQKWTKLSGFVKIRFEHGFTVSVPVKRPYFF